MADRRIRLRGVEVHNLKRIDLDLPHGQLIVICGASGSGKTSLALDTLYAEGQRRYIESFSARARQFLEQLDKPEAESIDGIPPAIAVTHKNTSRSSRATVGTSTETVDYLRLLMARIGTVVCRQCGQEVRRDNPQTAADAIAELPEPTRVMIAFASTADPEENAVEWMARLQEEGYVRAVYQSRVETLSGDLAERVESDSSDVGGATIDVVIDRLTAATSSERVSESLEAAMAAGQGRCCVYVEAAAEPEPRLLSFNSPLGACGECEGFGNVIQTDMDLVVPDASKSIRGGAIAPWNSPAYAHELEELLALADDYSLRVDMPFSELTDDEVAIIHDGVPERNFGGLRGFFAWLEKRKYKMHLRVFLSRWRSYWPCPVCQGSRLRAEALAVRLGDKNIAEICNLEIRDAVTFFADLKLTAWQQAVGRVMLEQVRGRLAYLADVGVGYLTLDRTLRTLSGGEAQRVQLTSALGSSLVNMLYVLDEPSVGLHPHDVDRLTQAVLSLRERQNTVVVVEHEETMLRQADLLVEIGPGAGEQGGRVIFQGTPEEIVVSPTSPTGQWLSGRRGAGGIGKRRPAERGLIRLTGARGNNLKNITVELPLGVLCLVTGVSGSGKSTLVQKTLYPALARRMRREAGRPLAHDDVFGDGQIDDLVLVDQSPIGRSPRSNPVTYIKAFDEMRAVFAETIEARTNNFGPSHFSFNVQGGRCEACQGDGYKAVDMQFLADVYMKCGECHGQRYRREILEVRYRNRNIAEVLEMTVREAFSFFRGCGKVQVRLKRLIDVGLDYLRLGQPANTLSGGEAQRLKLASYLSGKRRGRTLFVLDEPTTGLHFSDVLQLIDCFDSLLDVGHSLIVVEHNLQLMRAADYIIDIGPGAADEGGQVVAQGTPEEIAQNAASATAAYLAQVLAAGTQEQTA